MRPILGKIGRRFFGLLTNGDQSLAAKPGFHPAPPNGGDRPVMTFRHGSDSRLKVLEQQLENKPVSGNGICATNTGIYGQMWRPGCARMLN